MVLRVVALALTLFLTSSFSGKSLAIATPPSTYLFDFGQGNPAQGYTKVLTSSFYSAQAGYGFLPGSITRSVARRKEGHIKDDFITSDRPFYFTLDVPEGNYDVEITLGDLDSASVSTVRAECRRLMLRDEKTAKGEVVARSFTVNVRYPEIDNTTKVKLKARELNYLHWDHQLTLEFSPGSKICGIRVKPNTSAVNVFLAGNSTVTDQPEEPWAAWGQMIPAFFVPGKVVIANHAESGETLKSFVGERRLAKVASLLKAGDYLFIEFAHNDQKEGSSHVDPYTTYTDMLGVFIEEARKHKAIPVLVTSMNRRVFDSSGSIRNTLGDYPDAMRKASVKFGVDIIDLNAMSKTLYEALGPEKSKKAFVHYPAGTYPGQEKELKDDTHFNTYGAWELAQCMAQGIKSSKLPLKTFLKPQFKGFSPSSPDAPEAIQFPLGAHVSTVKPFGN